jgi:hypothetical protein
MSRLSRRGIWFAGVLLLCFWSLASHPAWVDDAVAPAGMILFLAFIYRWLFAEKITARGIWFAAALFVSWYLAFYTEWSNSGWALAGLILFLCFFHGLLWPQEGVSLQGRGERRTVEITTECSFSRISERPIDKPIRQDITAQSRPRPTRE